jgi:MFS family permease
MPAPDDFNHPLRWFAFWILLIGGLMDMVDATIVNIALPSIARTLGAGDTALEWIASGYLLVFAVSLIAAGRLGDRFGRKRLFLIGVALFGAFSLGAGLAATPAELIAMRLFQGLSAGLMVPQLLSSVRSLFAGSCRRFARVAMAPRVASKPPTDFQRAILLIVRDKHYPAKESRRIAFGED